MNRYLAIASYGVTSTAILIVNNLVLHVWGFPSPLFLAWAQCVCSACTLLALEKANAIEFKETWRDALKMAPYTVLFLGNLVLGLMGTGALSLPMFTLLRRTNIIMTMVLEHALLGQTYSYRVLLAAGCMVLGAAIAATNDVSFDAKTYATVLGNNVCTSLNGVYLKKEKDAFGMMYLNSVVCAVLLTGFLRGDAVRYEGWTDARFVAAFTASCFMAILLQLSAFYCTRCTSPLTTVVTGVVKNVVTSYAGLWWEYSTPMFVGLTVSMLGSAMYVL